MFQTIFGTSAATSSVPGKTEKPLPKEEAERRAAFEKYIDDMASFHRNVIADRVEVLGRHTQRWVEYAIGAQVLTIGMVALAMKRFAPRHVFDQSCYYMRPSFPTIVIGMGVYYSAYYGQILAMKTRIWTLCEEFELDLKKVHGHYIPAGMRHLQWLEFVLDQVKRDNSYKLDSEKMRASGYVAGMNKYEPPRF